MALRKLFDLHIEVGQDNTGNYYALSILGQAQPIVQYHALGQYMADAVCDVVCEMDVDSMLLQLSNTPQISNFPFPGSQPASTSPAVNSGKQSSQPKQRPADITTVPHPNCQAICISYENFGTSKCKSICAQRKI